MIAIFDDHAGYLQHISVATTTTAALAEFDTKIGIDPNSKGLDVIADEFSFYEVASEEAAAMESEDSQNCQPRGHKISY